MPLIFEQKNLLDVFCNVICNKPKIRFCGIINSMGRIIAGSFKDNIQPLDNEQERQMLYMQSKLELSMKAEFNHNLGHVNYVVTYRDNVIIINIPSDNQQFHILISAERISNPQTIVNDVADLFKQMENEIQPTLTK
jgi:hypothetical protein